MTLNAQRPIRKSDCTLRELSLVITAYNEEEALPKLFVELMSTLGNFIRLELIIVNDGSTDRTSEVIEELVELFSQENREGWSMKVITFEENRGMGAALKAGYQVSSEPWVTFLPGDGQIEPRMIERLFERLDQQSAVGVDLVTTRYTNREYSLFRKILSHGLRWMTFAIIWTNITSEGMYLIRRDLLSSMPLISDSFMINLEIPIRASERQVTIEIAEIEVRERQGGVSHATQWRRILNTFKDLIILKRRLLRERRS